LRAALVPHFQAEETAGGFFDVVRDAAPRHLGRVAQLAREHEAFLAGIDDLVAGARACLAGPVAQVLTQAEQLAGRLRAHEAGENELMIDALYVDIGEEA
jgi:hypothetical protein